MFMKQSSFPNKGITTTKIKDFWGKVFKKIKKVNKKYIYSKIKELFEVWYLFTYQDKAHGTMESL